MKSVLFKISTFLMCVVLAYPALAWFDPYGPYKGKIVVTRANTYVSVPTNINLSTPGVSLVGTNFFDYGDHDLQITAAYGGSTSDQFAVAWPVSLYVYFFTNSFTEAEGGGYDIARLQYMEGTNSGSSTNWIDVPGSPITNFSAIMGTEGGHFGLITWTPPKTNDVFYLIRIWARLKNGWRSAPIDATNIDKDGNISQDWLDYEVLLVKAIKSKKPGTRTDPQVSEFSNQPEPVGFWKKLWLSVKSLFHKK